MVNGRNILCECDSCNENNAGKKGCNNSKWKTASFLSKVEAHPTSLIKISLNKTADHQGPLKRHFRDT